MIYENENDADGILRVLQELHQYVPFDGHDDERVYGQQAVVGDQLSVEREVNRHCSLENGFTPEERLGACILRSQTGMEAISSPRLVDIILV